MIQPPAFPPPRARAFVMIGDKAYPCTVTSDPHPGPFGSDVDITTDSGSHLRARLRDLRVAVPA